MRPWRWQHLKFDILVTVGIFLLELDKVVESFHVVLELLELFFAFEVVFVTTTLDFFEAKDDIS